MGEDKKNDKGGDTNRSTDVESSAQKLPYPKSVFFILIMEFCERFCYYGMRTILTLFIKNVLKFNDDTSTVIYHAFAVWCYLTSILGAMLSDSFLGKFRTIFYLSVVYVAGNVILSLAATPPLNLPATGMSMLGLVLIGIGTGGIKPCVSAFGGDQFILPQQEAQLAGYFAIFYASINCGSLISTFITPIFRKDIKCFGDDTCYPLAFGVPAALMIAALVVFLLGRVMYIVKKPTGNVMVDVVKTIGHALSRKRKSKDKREHWLDYADDKYRKRDIEDVKILLRVLFLYLPLPFFWSLYDQQGSRWTLQAARMDGDLGGFVLKPDQLGVINPILILLFIPMFDRGIYPLLAKCNILKTPLQRLVVGGVFAGLSFVISGVVELELQKTYPAEMGTGQGHLNFVNMGAKDLTGKLLLGEVPTMENIALPANSNFLVGILEQGDYVVEFNAADDVDNKFSFEFPLADQQASTILIVEDSAAPEGHRFILPVETKPTNEQKVGDQLEKSGEGNPYVSILQSGVWLDPTGGKGGDEWEESITERNRLFEIVLREFDSEDTLETYKFTDNRTVYSDWNTAPPIEIDPTKWMVYVDEIYLEDGKEVRNKVRVSDAPYEVLPGGSYVITVVSDGKTHPTISTHMTTITEPNSMNMLWLVPQYVVMSAGEVMFSVTIMDFSYSQAPRSMKSVMQSAWLMTVTMGNVIDIIIVELGLFKEQWKEFFLFAGLMFVDMAVFSYLAYVYQPADLSKSTDFEDEVPIKDDNDEDEDNGNRKGKDNSTYKDD